MDDQPIRIAILSVQKGEFPPASRRELDVALNFLNARR
jgi:hypothetical protein